MKRCFSLKRNKAFKRVYRAGKAQKCRSAVLLYTRGRHDSLRVGISVSKRLGNSVARNRIKRRLRAAIDCNFDRIAHGWNLVFIAREKAKDERFELLVSDVSGLLEKANLIAEPGAKR